MSQDKRAVKKLSQEINRFDQMFPELKSMQMEVRMHLVLTGRRNRVWMKPMWWLRWLYPVPIYIAWHVLHAKLPSGQITYVLDNAVLASLLCLVYYSQNAASRHYKKVHVHNELVRIELRPPICLICNYDLRGTPDESTSCPECGATIAPVTVTDENSSYAVYTPEIAEFMRATTDHTDDTDEQQA